MTYFLSLEGDARLTRLSPRGAKSEGLATSRTIGVFGLDLIGLIY